MRLERLLPLFTDAIAQRDELVRHPDERAAEDRAECAEHLRRLTGPAFQPTRYVGEFVLACLLLAGVCRSEGFEDVRAFRRKSGMPGNRRLVELFLGAVRV